MALALAQRPAKLARTRLLGSSLEKADARYRPALARTAYWLLTAATTTRVFGEVLRAAMSASWLRWLVVAAGLCQIAAIGLFFHTMWSRIRALGSRAREGKASASEELFPPEQATSIASTHRSAT